MFPRDKELPLFLLNFWGEKALRRGSIKSRGTYGNVYSVDLCGLIEI